MTGQVRTCSVISVLHSKEQCHFPSKDKTIYFASISGTET